MEGEACDGEVGGASGQETASMSGAMEEKKGDGRKKKTGLFWPINFIKHIKRISSGICQRVVKLE